MRKYESGIGLVEIMVALVLGLVVVLGITQIFVSSKQSFVMQDMSSRLQEDARYALTRITQDLRMAGTFGCLSLANITNKPNDFSTPIDWSSDKLTIVTSTPTSGGGRTSGAKWTILTDCRSSASTENSDAAPATGQIAIPIRKVSYKRNDSGALEVSESGGAFQPLISGVKSLTIDFGLAADAASTYVAGDYTTDVAGKADRIRSVRVTLVMDGKGKVADQSYKVVAALRNRLL